MNMIPSGFHAKHAQSCAVAKKLMGAPTASLSDGTTCYKVLCIPPMNPAMQSEVAQYRTCLEFLRAAEWAFVLDFSGLQDTAGAPVPFFDPLPTNWVVASADNVDDPRTTVYMGKASLAAQGYLVDDRVELFIVIPSADFLAADNKAFSWIGQYLSAMDNAEKDTPTYIVDSFAALTTFKSSVRRFVYGNLLDAIAAENTSSLLCSIPLVQALAAPALNQVLLPCQTAEAAQVVPVAADMWKFPNSELLHLYCGHLDGDLGAEEEQEEECQDGYSSSDECDAEELLSEDDPDAQDEAAEILYRKAVQTQLKSHALDFIHGTSPAHWSLFRENVVSLTAQMDKVQESFCLGMLRSYTLRHTFSAGGTTMLRQVLYNLREKFVCVSMWDFNDLQTLPVLRAALLELHDLTGLDVVVLIDLCSDAEYTGNIKVGLINDLMKMPYVRILVCEHIGDSNAPPPAVPAPSRPEPVARSVSAARASLHKADLSEALIQRTEQESNAIKETMSKLCGLAGRQLKIMEDSDVCRTIQREYFQEDGLLDTSRIKSEATVCTWQYDLVGLSCSNPSVLIQHGYWPIEVLELSSALDNAGAADKLLAQVSSTRDPLINIGFFLFGSTDYVERVKKVAYRIVNLLRPDDLFVLKTVVFAALFAPGLKLDKAFKPDYKPSSLLLGLVSKTVATSKKTPSNKKEYLAITVPSLAYILAENPEIFNVAPTGSCVACLYDYLKNVLLPHLSDGGPGDQRSQSHRRALIRPLLDRAFNAFQVWHWLPRRQTGKLRFSYLITLLWDYNSSKDAVTEMYCQYAKMIALDNYVLTEKEDRIKLKAVQDTAALSSTSYKSRELVREKSDQAKVALWSSEHARVVMFFLSAASRLREQLAYSKSKFSERTNEFNKCLSMLDLHLVAQMKAEIIPYRYATVHRRRLESYQRHLKSTDEPADWDSVESMCFSAEKFFEEAIQITKHAWAFPLVGLAQCRATMYDLLLFATQRKAKKPHFDNLVDHIAQLPRRHQFPTILAAVTQLGMKKSLSVLQEADIASTYIRKDDDQEHTRQLVLNTMVHLFKLSGRAPLPAEDALVDLMSGQDSMYTDGDKCIQYLYMLCTPLATLVSFEALDDEVPSWKSDLELVMKLSAAAHSFRPTSKLLKVERLQTFLQHRLVALMDKWKRAVVSGKAHGLGAHRAAVMLAVYYRLNPAEIMSHPYADKIPSLDNALRDVRLFYIFICASRIFLLFWFLLRIGESNGRSIPAYRYCALLCGAYCNTTKATFCWFCGYKR